MKKSDEPIRIFENAYDLKILPGIYIVARLDGRGFNSLTRKMRCNKPFDDNFNHLMVSVAKHLMKNGGFNIIYGYTQSDEISLLFNLDTDTFNRRISKLSSVLASMASSMFTACAQELVSFDCRISHLPSVNHVVDYFIWRMNDSHRNALNGYCHSKLRETLSTDKVVRILNKKNQSEMNEILFQNGINYNDVTTWHRRGTGLLWAKKEKEGINPITGEKKIVFRSVIYTEKELPCNENFSKLLMAILNEKI